MGWKTNTKTVKYKTFSLRLCSKKVEIVSMEKGSTRCAGSWYWVKSEEISYLKYGISKADKARLLRTGYSLVYKWDIRVHVLLTRGAYILTNNHSNQNQFLMAERAWRPAVKMMISIAYLTHVRGGRETKLTRGHWEPKIVSKHSLRKVRVIEVSPCLQKHTLWANVGLEQFL